MLKTLQAQQSMNPQAVEYNLEHPQSIALPNHPQADAEDFLVVSPYTSPPHLLDLGTLNQPQRFLAKALTLFSQTREDYATAPYSTSFNWPTVITHLRNLTQQSSHEWQHQRFYIVVFRSQIPPTTDRLELGELDQRSHAEATKSGGLLKYWFGMPDEDGRNLATCASFNPLQPNSYTVLIQPRDITDHGCEIRHMAPTI